MNAKIIKLALSSLDLEEHTIDGILEMMNTLAESQQENALLLLIGKYEMPRVPETIKLQLLEDAGEVTATFENLNRITEVATYAYYQENTVVYCTPEVAERIKGIVVDGTTYKDIRNALPNDLPEDAISHYKNSTLAVQYIVP